MRLLIILVILLATAGCRAKMPEPAVIPVIEQQWNGVTQYDYKAGPPNEYNNPVVNNEETVNPYLVPQGLDWSKYFPKLPDAPSTGQTSGGGGGWYYNPPYVPPAPIYTVFWSGSAAVTVQ